MEETDKYIDKFTPFLKESLKKIAENEEFETYDIVVNKIPTLGGSYSGELFAVDILGKTAEDEKELNLFVKKIVPEQVEKIKETGFLNEAYPREAFVYKELSNLFVELQDKYNVPQEERLKMVKGYGGSSDALILENVTVKGFKTEYRTDLMSYEYAKLALEELAKFHGFTFAIQTLQPTFYNERISSMKNVFNWPGWRKVLGLMIMTNANNLENIETRNKVLDFIPKALDKMQGYYEDDTRTRVLCHGDFRLNNILVKRTDGVIAEVIPVDYQTIFYGCPVTDILYFIYSGTDRKFREAHLEDLLDVYYNTMKRFLNYFDMDLNNFYPREAFDKDFEECRDFGLLASCMLMGLILVKEEDVIDFSKDEVQDWHPKMHESFQERFGDIVNEFL